MILKHTKDNLLAPGSVTRCPIKTALTPQSFTSSARPLKKDLGSINSKSYLRGELMQNHAFGVHLNGFSDECRDFVEFVLRLPCLATSKASKSIKCSKSKTCLEENNLQRSPVVNFRVFLAQPINCGA